MQTRSGLHYFGGRESQSVLLERVTMSAFLHPFALPAKADFITIVEGDRSEVIDSDGNRYIDAMAGLWFNSVGHGNERMIDAISAQLTKLAAFHTFGAFTNEPAEALCEIITDVSPFDDARVYLTNSGSEAVDSAIKIARITQHLRGESQRQMVISRAGGYHGVAMGGTSAQGIRANQEGFGNLLADFQSLGQNDLEAMSMLFSEHGNEIAAVITEPLQGAGGVCPPQDGYLAGLRRLCDQHGALLIFDEVICGFGRLGSWFGAEHYGVRPDMITFAKGVSSGYIPLGGVILDRNVCDTLEADPEFLFRHGHTYSGHPTAAIAGLTAIQIIQDENLVPAAARIGSRLSSGLKSLLSDGLVAEVRGEGAVWAADLGPGGDAAATFLAMQSRGVIARPLGTAIAFCPPFIITDEQVDRCVDALASAIGAVAAET